VDEREMAKRNPMAVDQASATRAQKQPQTSQVMNDQTVTEDPEPRIRGRLERHSALVRAAVRLWELKQRIFD
jgi:hypothetical protein